MTMERSVNLSEELEELCSSCKSGKKNEVWKKKVIYGATEITLLAYLSLILMRRKGTEEAVDGLFSCAETNTHPKHSSINISFTIALALPSFSPCVLIPEK